jgi:sigma-E factor negative regulatory protein RseA
MSDQIREQVSAFLDGELPNSETELLLKRLTRDAELRQSFGRYALIGETLRGTSRAAFSREFAARVNRSIDGESAAPALQAIRARHPRWWKPVALTAVAAGVAAVAVVGLQQRAIAPGTRAMMSQNIQTARPKEAISYTVPAAAPETRAVLPAARLTSYVFAHSKYSTGLGESNVLSGLLSDADEQEPPVDAHTASGEAAKAAVGAAVNDASRQPQPDTHTAP